MLLKELSAFYKSVLAQEFDDASIDASAVAAGDKDAITVSIPFPLHAGYAFCGDLGIFLLTSLCCRNWWKLY